jgi:Rps23 Pro-64 3,4-dihydroxylase Tpa1-like proline 4-hydroxylase
LPIPANAPVPRGSGYATLEGMRQSRSELARNIAERLASQQESVRREYRQPGRIPSFTIDDLLPPDAAQSIYQAFPSTDALVLKRTLGQLKFVGYQMDQYDPLLEEIIYAFQDPRVVQLISSITGLSQLLPDEHLYAGGVSLMAEGHFLNPHLDNSHDLERNHYRVLNLLYYVTPEWRDDYGGHLELWDEGPGKHARTMHSRFNRLVVMQTDHRSWHSVSKVRHAGRRCCVSNYYFSPQPAAEDGSYHVTSFRGWPQQKAADLLMRADSALRLAVRKVGGSWLFKNPHVYKK